MVAVVRYCSRTRDTAIAQDVGYPGGVWYASGVWRWKELVVATLSSERYAELAKTIRLLRRC